MGTPVIFLVADDGRMLDALPEATWSGALAATTRSWPSAPPPPSGHP